MKLILTPVPSNSKSANPLSSQPNARNKQKGQLSFMDKNEHKIVSAISIERTIRLTVCFDVKDNNCVTKSKPTIKLQHKRK
jgi:hypothetical protein